MSVLLLLELTKSKQLKSYSAPAGTSTFKVPKGVTKLETVTGRGQNGTEGSYVNETFTLASVSKSSTQSGGVAEINNNVYSDGISESTKFYDSTGIRRVSYNSYIHTVGQDNLVKVTSSARTARIQGNPTTDVREGSGGTNAPITYSMATTPRVTLTALSLQSGSDGADTTGFGQTFAGGIGGPASTRVVNNVAVTPETTYSLFVAPGGSLTITYYE